MKTHRTPILLALTLAAAGAALAAEPGYRLLHGLNRLDDAKVTWGTNVAEKELVLSADAAYRSEGSGSLHLRGLGSDHKGNQYLGVKIAVPKTDLVDRRLRFDAWSTTPETTNALYVRYYNAKGEMVGSWHNWGSPFRKKSAQTFSLRTGTSGRGFRHEANNVKGRVASAVVAIEFIIGTREKNAAFDVFIDNLRVSKETIASAMALTKPKKLFLDTVLVADGKPAATIVSPADAEHMAVAQRIRDALGLPIVNDMSAEEMAKTNVVLLGNVNTNRSFAPLYAYSYTAADANYPGPGGYALRTVHDPWGTGRNAVVLAGHAAKEVGMAADELLKLARDPRNVALPRVLKVKLGADPTRSLGAYTKTPRSDYVELRVKAAKRALDRGAHGGITGMIADEGTRYALTGHEAYAQAFKELVFLMYEHYLTKPKTYGGPWGMDADFRLYKMLPALDLVEESPSLTDEDRLKITNIYVLFINDCISHAQSVLGGHHPRHNHQTFPSLGLLYAGSYFKKYYAAAEADYWLEIADACFQVQAQGAKPHEDCNGYQWLTSYHTLRYVLGRPDFTWFRNNNAQRIADYCLLCMDNLGYQVPYGDTGSWRCWGAELPYLRAAAWFTRDGRYYFALAKKADWRPQAPAFEYATTGPIVEPVDLLGTRAWPVDRRYYDAWRQGRPPLPVTVDKVVMRASFDPDKQYLLLDGLSNGGHKHYDGNTISRITDRNRIWLADNEYIRSLPKYHNGVLVIRDGQSAKIPPYCELEHIADFDTLGFSETVVRDYAGANWHRNIIWAKERYFLVIDEMEATEDNAFSFRTLWHTVGEVEVGDDGLRVEQKGKRFFVKHTPGVQTKLHDDLDLGRNWAGYPYADPVVRVFQEIADAQLKAGESYRIFNLLHASDDERPLDLKLRRVGESCAVVSGDAQELVGVAGVDSAGKVRVAAEAFHLEASGFALVAGTELRWRERTVLRADKPILIDARDGSARIIAGEPTRVELLASQAEPVVAGQVGRVERQGDRVVLHDVVGECRIAGIPTTLNRFDETVRSLPTYAPMGRQVAEAATPPPLEQLWKLTEKLDAYLLTGNARYFEAVDVGAVVTCEPKPLAANVFSGKADGTNNMASLTDGALRTTEGCVMWDTDQPVTLTVDLKRPHQLSRIKIKAWWADSSSKGKTFQLQRATFEASNDAFARDVRKLGEIVDTETHGNWGAPGYSPQDYELAGIDADARYVRIKMTPRAGTGLYLAELEVWGNREGLSIDLAEKKRRGVPVHTFISLHAADVDGDGKDEIAAGSTNGSVYLVDSDGATLWKHDTGGQVNAVTVAEFEAGRRAVVSGSANARVCALAAGGAELWEYDIPAYKGTPVVRTIFPADLDGDGKQEVVCGAHSWRYYALDRDGKLLWHNETVRKSTAGVAADLDRDGKDEVIAGTNYYWWTCINSDGSRRWRYSSRYGPMVNDVVAGNIAGDEKLEVVFGSANANVMVAGHDGKPLWTYNTGDEVTAVAIADLDGDGVGEVLAASKSFNVYALKGNGERLWRADLGDAVSAMAVLRTQSGSSLIAAGTESGRVAVLDATGKIVRELRSGDTKSDASPPSVLKLVAVDLDGDGADEVVVSGDDGSLRALR